MKVHPITTKEFNGLSWATTKKLIERIRDYPYSTWKDFAKLDELLGRKDVTTRRPPFLEGFLTTDTTEIDTIIIESMQAIAIRATPELLSHPYSRSNLLRYATSPLFCTRNIYGQLFSSTKQKTAAGTMRMILEKSSHPLPDEEQILKIMLTAQAPCAQPEALLAMVNKNKNQWEISLNESGLLEAVESDSFYIQDLAIYVLAQTTYKSLSTGAVGTNTDYLTDSKLIKSILSFTKANHEHHKSNAFYLLCVICGRTGIIDNEALEIFKENLDSENHYLRINSLYGIANILTRRKIDDRRLEDKLIKCASLYLDQPGVRDALRSIYFSLKSDRLRNSTLSSISIVE